MATEPINIIVTEKGTRVVQRRLGGLAGAATKTAGAVQVMNRALLLIGGTVAIRQLVNLSDAYTNIQNRLRIVTDSTAELVVIQKELLQVSNDTRTSFEANAELFVRTAIATRSLGLSQENLIRFTKALGQATVLSGASAIEATNAIRQLTQGLASGQLRGEEFRSVAEQLPIVLNILADDMGITIGQLRELAFEGRITAEVLVGGMLKAAEDLDRQFKETTPTVGQALTVLRNSTLDLVGAFSTGTGIGREFAEAILGLAGNIGLVARILATGGIALAIGLITTKVIALTVAIAANPLGALITGATLAISALVAFSDQISLTSDGAADFRDFMVVSFQAIQTIFVNVFSNMTAILQTFTGNLQITASNGEGVLLTFIRVVARAVDAIGGTFKGLKNFIVAAFEDLPRALGNIFVAAFNGILKIVEEAAQGVIDLINPVLTFAGLEPLVAARVGQLKLPFQQNARDLGQAFRDGFVEGVGAESLLDNLVIAAESRAQARLAETELKKFQENEAQRALSEFNAAGQTGEVGPDQSVLAGFKNGLAEIQAEILDFASLTEDAMTNAFGSAEDALVEFVQTGKFNFNDLVSSILADLTRLVARQALVGLLSQFAGGAFGAIGGSTVSSFAGARQFGGDVNANNSVLVGERGPELFTPSVPGTITPAAAPQAPPQVNVSVVNVTDPNDVTSALATPDGEKAILNVIRRNPRALEGVG